MRFWKSIGRGGMGTVLKARDPKPERLVAVKVLNPDLATNGQAREVFRALSTFFNS